MLIVERPTVLAGSRAPSDQRTIDPLRPVPLHGATGARIGPNTIIQLAHVLRDRYGEGTAGALLFEGTGYALNALPSAMVDEREAQALVRTVMQSVGEQRGVQLLHEAGQRTADYLMAHRIPRPAQWVMKALPRRAGLSILLRAMQANAWTFTGSGTFSVLQRPKLVELSFHACAMCRDMTTAQPVCDFYAGTFEQLIRTIVAPQAQVREVECMATGGHCCRFEVTGIH